MTKFFKPILSVMLLAVFSVFTTACSEDDDEVFGTCEISGMVTDSIGNPIEGVTVRVHAVDVASTSAKATTNQDGYYILTTDEATTSLLIIAEAEGFYTYGEVLENIPFSGSTPGITLGSAKISVDLIMHQQANRK